MEFNELVKTLKILSEEYGLREIVISSAGYSLMKDQSQPYLFKPLQDAKQLPNIESFDRIGDVKISVRPEQENTLRHLTIVEGDNKVAP